VPRRHGKLWSEVVAEALIAKEDDDGAARSKMAAYEAEVKQAPLPSACRPHAGWAFDETTFTSNTDEILKRPVPPFLAKFDRAMFSGSESEGLVQDIEKYDVMVEAGNVVLKKCSDQNALTAPAAALTAPATEPAPAPAPAPAATEPAPALAPAPTVLAAAPTVSIKTTFEFSCCSKCGTRVCVGKTSLASCVCMPCANSLLFARDCTFSE
jgi:hypothetical protein